MSKKKIRLWLVILVVVLGLYGAYQIKMISLENSLKNYLIEEKGYQPSEISSIKATMSKMPTFPVYVRFADELDKQYVFTDRGTSDWTQIYPENPKR